MENYRCFLAVDLPDELKGYLAGLQNQLKNWPARVKWVEPDNFHLTLKFLGDTPVNKIPEINTVLQMVAGRHHSWLINLGSPGAFPKLQNPKVIWVGVDDQKKGLTKLWQDIESCLERIGVPREKKPFSPHLTIGRVKSELPVPGFAETISKINKSELSCPITEFRLMRSVLTSAGPVYSCINSFFLQEH